MIPRSKRNNLGLAVCFTVALQLFNGATAQADDGYRLWLRYDPLPMRMVGVYRPLVTSVVVSGNSGSLEALRTELVSGCSGLLARAVPPGSDVKQDGAVVAGTPESSTLIKSLRWEAQLAALGPEGFRIRSVKVGSHSATVIASTGEVGALYGAFYFLRLLQTLQP